METLICGLILALLSGVVAERPGPPTHVIFHPAHCSQINRLNPDSPSGVYWIQPDLNRSPFKAFCEMRPDGGWTVIQRRTGASVSFHKNWAAYEAGFGHLTWDHWLGLEKTFWLTRGRKGTLRVDLWDHEGGAAYAEYQDFHLGDRYLSYPLYLGTYRGTAGDAFRGSGREEDQSRMGFTTRDRDSRVDVNSYSPDEYHRPCPQLHRSGWWFRWCGAADLNGVYHATGQHLDNLSGLHWRTWKGRPSYSLKATRMMVKLKWVEPLPVPG